MSVRQSLLAILDQGPCYGYQLRAEFDRRTGGTWPLNVGQIYNTLDRLERDGLVAKTDTDDEGHVYYAITQDGSAEAAEWLSSPVDRTAAARDELAIKLALAATLPGVDVRVLIAQQRAASLARLEALVADRAGPSGGAGGTAPSTSTPGGSDGHGSDGRVEDRVEDLAAALVSDALVEHAKAEVRWLDSAAARLERSGPGAAAVPLLATPPRRGRPVRDAAAS
jgi:DNA-binding PadR family transcriptional regulator